MLYLWAKKMFVQAINKITSPGDVEDEEVLNGVLQKGKDKGKRKRKKKCMG